MARTPLFRNLILALQKARSNHLKAQNLPQPITLSSLNCSRRKFLKNAALMGAVGLAGSCFPLVGCSSNKSDKPKVAIIGGGIAGLNAAYQLQKSGVNATVYEANSRIGGRMLSVPLENQLVVDLGAELINTDHEDMLSLVEELDITLFNRVEDSAASTFPADAFYFGGVAYSEDQLAADLELIAAQITSDAALLDEDWDTNAPIFDELSVEDYLTQHADKITKPYILDLFKNVMRTEFGVETDESSAIQFILVLPVIDGQSVDLLSYSDEVYSVVGGSSKITDALGEKLGDNIKLEKTLTKIKKEESNYLLTFADDSTVTAEYVIVAIPFTVLSGITIDAPIPSLLSSFISEAKMGSNEKVIGGFSSRFWKQENGFTNAAWVDGGFSEVWDETSRQSSLTNGALNFFLGGDQARALSETTDLNSLGTQFVAELDAYLPGATSAATGKFIKSSWTNSSLTKGGYANYEPGQLTQYGSLLWIESEDAEERQEVVFDKLIFIGEQLSDAYYGFMNGGAQTGRLAAQYILAEIEAT